MGRPVQRPFWQLKIFWWTSCVWKDFFQCFILIVQGSMDLFRFTFQGCSTALGQTTWLHLHLNNLNIITIP